VKNETMLVQSEASGEALGGIGEKLRGGGVNVTGVKGCHV